MGLQTNSNRGTFVNIKEGKLYTKEKDKDPVFFDSISGTITGVNFKEEEYQGKTYEKCELQLVDGDDRFILAMRVDSGYFRGFVNSLKSGNPTKPLEISPSSKLVNDRPQTTCFVKQNGTPLKHAYTRDNPGDLPQLESVTFKGQQMWDSTKQTEFWKNWLNGIDFTKQESKGYSASNVQPSDISPEDDLPF